MAVDATPPLAFEESSSPPRNGGLSAMDASDQLGEDGAIVIRPCKPLEKQTSWRRKFMDKSVLDDIMGDPDDFQDLADCDLPSECDGGKRYNAVRAPLEDGSAAGKVQNSSELPQQESARILLGEDSSKTSKTQTGEGLLESSHGSRSYGGEGSSFFGRNNQRLHALSGDDGRHHILTGSVGDAPKQDKIHHTRYFIIKSLNHHNIEKSIEKGIWATQAMNETVLNEAFETSEKVVLVFSVNMSSHFQGYALMSSPIGQRRANIWSEANEGANPWGGTFHVEWLRLYDLPFQKTVHLKNPLNAFKPVKISRDCQELTQAIGKALCALIDEGANREGRPKRKLGIRDVDHQLGKRSREVPEGLHRPRILTAPLARPAMPLLYSSSSLPETHLPKAMIRPSNGCTNKCIDMSGPRRSSESRSPTSASSERSDRVREKERGAEKERMRSSSSTRSVDLEFGEDLVNMTYEQYLQRHGQGHLRDCNSYPQESGLLRYQNRVPGYGGWMVGGPSAGFCHDEAYVKYVASWYGLSPSNGGMRGVDHGYEASEYGWRGHQEEMDALMYKRY
ncbi:uncharacterized protein [Physcomitrium patens]|uniref:YTH domain-containing protein n=1 Tax=Physcomitrium patens TaxID=3218 RepID=A0A7I4FUA4_PHYPA|nr:YTH domain-containing protein 1-like isoform X3 [Physcomitrium patens]XP_024383021.1 YTH domain-containing protein 1-like isoform X3 [Physcomitrium patens]XP_024383022.1 YTH domain-containing protein 1-like isoform X3 [Physcomitrium patens]|eukprot:XP_024383020.1 YTH domain-containing protein 1-like isoform X3 [Physcomitrella patens]